MKAFVAVAILALCVAVQGVTEEQKQKVQEYGRVCLEETGADREEIKKLRLGETSDDVDDKVKCFVKCIFRKSGFFDEHDEFVTDVAVNKLSLDSESDTRDSVTEAVKECQTKTGTDACDRAYHIYKCYQNLKHVSLV